MSKINRPVTHASIINDLQRRVRTLETMQRVSPTSTVIPKLVPSNYVAYDTEDRILKPAAYSVTATNTGISTVDGTTVTLPAVTVTGSVVQVMWTWEWTNWDADATSSSFYKAAEIYARLTVDGTPVGLGWSRFTHGTDNGEGRPEAIIGVVETSGGEHTFSGIWAANASPATSPVFEAMLSTQSLVAIPLKL